MINTENKKPMRKRTKHIDFKLSESEFKEIEKIAKEAKLSKQEFLYRSAFDKEILVLENGVEILRELIRIGVNINQIAKVANSSGKIYPEELEKVKWEVKKIWQSLNLSPKRKVEV